MSYDIRFKVKVEGTNCWLEVGECDANITWNVREIIVRSTGLEWKNEENNGLCSEIMPYIEKGLIELATYPEKYKEFEAPNGWGTVNGTKRFFARILEAWNKFCEWNELELVAVTTFWIE